MELGTHSKKGADRWIEAERRCGRKRVKEIVQAAKNSVACYMCK